MTASLRAYLFTIGLLFTPLTEATAVKAAKQETITVFAAASLTDALEKLAQQYKDESKETAVRFSFAASSTLARQIEAGAPADIFISANEEWTDYLAAKKLIASVCHGAAGLVTALRPDGQSIVKDLRVNSFTDAEEVAVGLEKVVPFMLETRLRELGGRFEGAVLDWNADALRFYESLGAKPIKEWIICRLAGEPLRAWPARWGSRPIWSRRSGQSGVPTALVSRTRPQWALMRCGRFSRGPMPSRQW